MKIGDIPTTVYFKITSADRERRAGVFSAADRAAFHVFSRFEAKNVLRRDAVEERDTTERASGTRKNVSRHGGEMKRGESMNGTLPRTLKAFHDSLNVKRA